MTWTQGSAPAKNRIFGGNPAQIKKPTAFLRIRMDAAL
jgi:hypothetical protein